jgi:hypothetical protein
MAGKKKSERIYGHSDFPPGCYRRAEIRAAGTTKTIQSMVSADDRRGLWPMLPI